ncbi:hypothetical protein [Helicobacter bizzozeronii]|nr:hypothetical protein [Helicobacter bizzozeronii]
MRLLMILVVLVVLTQPLYQQARKEGHPLGGVPYHEDYCIQLF